nr:MAG TPA: cytochrome c554 [Caudoviricetes sp.]
MCLWCHRPPQAARSGIWRTVGCPAAHWHLI